MAFDEQWRAVADLRTSIVSATTATTANVPSLKKNRKKGKYSVFSSFYSNWQLAVVAVVALTHVNGSYGEMLYMAGWRQQRVKKTVIATTIGGSILPSENSAFED
ncbi:hypothetical protein [uncultured Prevotella sp.]|uniref:hypothetical protein n=1 Tax=uncultured Prevotella sp. TaxID=159272 RepID=UPI00260912F3|nr:hypothetical protein [uncultured Prevotella sp.]